MANFRKNIRFTDVCEKFTNSSEMDFSEWFDKARAKTSCGVGASKNNESEQATHDHTRVLMSTFRNTIVEYEPPIRFLARGANGGVSPHPRGRRASRGPSRCLASSPLAGRGVDPVELGRGHAASVGLPRSFRARAVRRRLVCLSTTRRLGNLAPEPNQPADAKKVCSLAPRVRTRSRQCVAALAGQLGDRRREVRRDAGTLVSAID